MNVPIEMLEGFVVFPDFLKEFKISMTTKLIYSVIFTEVMKQKLVDEEGRRYVEITIGEIAEQTNIRKGIVEKSLYTLSRIDLIDYRKESNRIYPRKPVSGEKKSNQGGNEK